MAIDIFDISQVTIKESDCDAKSSTLEKVDCLKLLQAQYETIIKRNTDDLNADENFLGSYANLNKLVTSNKSDVDSCGININCQTAIADALFKSKSYVKIRQDRVNDVTGKLILLKSKIGSLQNSPVYVAEVKKKSVTTYLIIVIVVVIIVIAVWAFRKYRAK